MNSLTGTVTTIELASITTSTNRSGEPVAIFELHRPVVPDDLVRVHPSVPIPSHVNVRAAWSLN